MTRLVHLLVPLVGWGLLLTAGAQTNLPASSPLVEPASCVERMRQLVDLTADLRDSLTNHPAALDCLRAKQTELQTLLDVSEASLRRLRVLEQLANSPDQEERLDQERGRIFVAYSRAERLRAQALACLPAEINTSSQPQTNQVAAGAAATVPPPVPRRPLAQRDGPCISQGDAARMLALAMELVIDARQETVACETLSEHQIEPPGGWQPARCLYLEDLYVIAAKALRLVLADADDPQASAQALRSAGLPLDRVLPPQVPGRQVPVLEPEWRAFLAAGRAARP